MQKTRNVYRKAMSMLIPSTPFIDFDVAQGLLEHVDCFCNVNRILTNNLLDGCVRLHSLPKTSRPKPRYIISTFLNFNKLEVGGLQN